MKKLILASASLFLTITCQAKIITVDDDGPADFNSIQLAINFATYGDTVIVAPGTYIGPGNRDIDFLGKAIIVQSSDPNDPNIVENTIIDCNGTRDEEHRGFTFHSGEDANSVLNGFTITNGHAESGSGILCEHSSPTIADCIISGNTSRGRSGGGAISIFSSICLINNCTITNNKGGSGNGIYCSVSNPTLTNCTFSANSSRGMVNEDSNPTLTNCTFTGNSYCGMVNVDSNPTLTNCTFSENSSREGGGMYNRRSNPTLTNCTFSGNSSHEGGGMYNEDESSPILTNCTFSSNLAVLGGGGMNNLQSNPNLFNCIFIGNSTETGYGGGIFCKGGSSTITDCIISDNSLYGRGGGGGISIFSSICLMKNCIINDNKANKGGGIYCSDSSPTITNCTITDNSAERGSALYNSQSSPILINCILWGNMPEEIFGSSTSPVVTYSNVQGGWPGEGNIDQDPGFVFPHDYHLTPGSPCIDAGTNTPIDGLPENDIDGNPRPLDGNGDTDAVVDMGAYEYNPNSPSIAVSERIVSFTYDWLKPHPQPLLIRNCGGGTLQWQIFEDCPWLQVSPTNGVSTSNINEVTLTVDPNGLALGYYSCVLRVRDPHAVNSPVAVQVTLYVGVLLRVPDDFFTIQQAINAANDGDIVIVAPGTYTGPGNRDIDFLGKAIKVQSENGPENCIIDCNASRQDNHRGFFFHSGEDAKSVLDGFTITNGCTRDGGGGILCEHSSPTLTNCTFISNSIYGYGDLHDWPAGGGVANFNSNPKLTNCIFSGNSAYSGGGMANYYGNPTITNCTFSDNSSGYGGGMENANAGPTINNCTFSGNSAVWYGGGMSNWPVSNPKLTNCTFSGNLAGEDGGGMFNDSSRPILKNCTFTKNSADDNGGGMFNWRNNRLTLENCILWDNIPEQINSSAVVTYSNIQGGWPGEGNIDADPCFVLPGYWADVNDTNIIVEPNGLNAVWIKGDYHLLPDSPCIDAATDAAVYTDIEGNPRPFDFPGIDNNGELPDFDMGAYEATAQEAELMLLPRTINRSSRQSRILARLRLPEGTTKDQIDQDTLLVLYPGNIQATRQYVFQNRRWGQQRTSVFAFFDKAELMEAVDDNGRVQLQVLGHYADPGRYFYGSDTIRITGRGSGPHSNPRGSKRKNIAFH